MKGRAIGDGVTFEDGGPKAARGSSEGPGN